MTSENGERRPDMATGRRTSPRRTAPNVEQRTDTRVQSSVHHASAPSDQFSRIPNSFIRDPQVKPTAKIVILWFASQAEGRSVCLKTLSEDTGIALRTVHNGLGNALHTPYLTRRPTGHLDRQGNPSYVYVTDLEADANSALDRVQIVQPSSADSAPDRVQILHTKKNSKKTKEKLAAAELSPDDYLAAGRKRREDLTTGQIADAFAAMVAKVPGRKSQTSWQDKWRDWIDSEDPRKNVANPLPSYTQPPRPSDDELTWDTGLPHQEAAGGQR